MSTLTIRAHGIPAPQGSKTAFLNHHTGRVVMTDKNPKALKSWRQDVYTAALHAVADAPPTTDHGWLPFTGPLHITVCFYMPRPKAHYRTGKHAHELRTDAPTYVDKRPDLDKLARGVLDALTTAAVYTDDSQVAMLAVEKRYLTHGQAPGALITVRPTETTHPAALADAEQGVLL